MRSSGLVAVSAFVFLSSGCAAPAPEPSAGDTPEVTEAPVSSRALRSRSLSYECNEGVCFCEGVADCLKLGASGICKPDTWCEGTTCVCWDKSRF